MIHHYLKVAFRNMLKYRTQSLISIIGLSVGFVCFTLASLWAYYEQTYDNFHEGADRIYLAGNENEVAGDQFSAWTSGLLSGYLEEHFPEIEKASRISFYYDKRINHKGAEHQLAMAEIDSSFLSMFHITTIEGNTHLRLEEGQIALTEQAAKRIFGEESPIGKQIQVSDRGNAETTVVALLKSWKGHSVLSFEALLPVSSSIKESWTRQQFYTLFRAYPQTNIDTLQKKLTNIQVAEEGYKTVITVPVTPLTTLRSTHPLNEVHVKLNHIRIFALIGGLVIFCGLCNYLTMLVTRIKMRRRELALRQVNGASNSSIFLLLISELLLLLFISALVGLMLIEIILPAFRSLSQIEESTSFFYMNTIFYLLALIGITICFSFILIWYIRRKTLLSNIDAKSFSRSSGWFRKGSLLLQLTISIGLIFCTSVMMKQLHFLTTSNELGMERHNIAFISYSEGLSEAFFDKTLSQMPDVTSILKGYNSPVLKKHYMTNTLDKWDNKADNDKDITAEIEVLGKDFADFFHVTLLEGNIPDEKECKGKIVLNEAAAKAFGWHDPIGKKIFDLDEPWTVAGIIRDIQSTSPIYPVLPVIYFSIHDKENAEGKKGCHMIFKFRESSFKQVTQALQDAAHRENPDNKMIIVNIEDEYKKYLQSESSLMKLLSVVSLVCIAISIFGIFSLVTLSCEQRRKEIAIRKVNGASAGTILHLFFQEYLILLLVASIVAFPLGYVVMKHWLESYVKQTTMAVWIYIVIFLGVAAVIFISIIWRVWKAARQNPAEVIKNE